MASKKNTENEIYQVHDKFFKSMMSQTEVFSEFVERYLPPEVQKHLELASLELIEPKRILPTLKLQEADILFRCKLAGIESYLLVLMEHKSYKDRHTAIQILRYMVEIWETEFHQGKGLRPILPMVCYQGMKKWQYPQLESLFGREIPVELKSYLPVFESLYYDFSLENKENLRGNKIKLDLLLRAITTIYEPTRESMLRETMEIFRVVQSVENIEYYYEAVERIITYISANRKDISDEDLVEIAKQTGGNEMIETIADRFERRGEIRGRQEGLHLGMQRGRRETRIEFAISMLEDGCSVEQIMRYTKLTAEEIRQLKEGMK